MGYPTDDDFDRARQHRTPPGEARDQKLDLWLSYLQGTHETATYPNAWAKWRHDLSQTPDEPEDFKTWEAITAALTYSIVGLGGEAGEISNKWKKILRENVVLVTREQREALLDECGDVLWYLARICHHLGVSLHDVALRNLKKLEDRMDRGALYGDGDER